MSVGDLSVEQAKYVADVSAGTGLDPTVVTAWVGAESPWSSTKPDHNYLNVGPGENYPSTDVAAARVVDLIRNSSNYAGIRQAIPAGPAAQVAAIKSSPWDAGHYADGTLDAVYGQLHAAGGAQVNADPVTATAVSFNPADWSSVFGWLNPATAGEKVVQSAVSGAFQAGLTLLLAAAGVGLVVLGLNRLTGRSIAEHAQQVQQTVSTVGQAASLAAL